MFVSVSGQVLVCLAFLPLFVLPAVLCHCSVISTLHSAQIFSPISKILNVYLLSAYTPDDTRLKCMV